jgi:uncharacterized membrane-anchored protein
MNQSIRLAAVTAVCLFLPAASALAQTPAAKPSDAEIARLRGILEAQHPQFGDVKVAGPDVTLHLSRRYYFLGAAEAKQVLKEWGNPPEQAEGVLGIVFPAGKTFVDETWGAVITFEASGYVSDKDADKADYAKMVRDEQAAEGEENEARKKNGFPSIHLVGWAQPPSYDKAAHALIWARDLQFAGETPDTLNYDVRVLGRRGVLSVNMVSTMPQLTTVRADAAALAGDITFDPGGAYSDFQAGRDKTAEYGVAGLVAAGLGLAAAQKLGLLAAILLFAKKGIVLIVAGFAAVTAWARRMFGRGKAKPAAGSLPPPQDEEPPHDAA